MNERLPGIDSVVGIRRSPLSVCLSARRACTWNLDEPFVETIWTFVLLYATTVHVHCTPIQE